MVVWRRLALVFLPAPVLGSWFLAKGGLFRGLEYTSDVIAIVQLSRGWLLGWPVLRENRFGDALVGHNFFLGPPLGLLTLPWGAYGLFLFHAGLIYLASLELLRTPRGPSLPYRLALTLVFLLGPVGFWIWDNPLYGWHFGLLFAPLSILLAGALGRRSRWAWLWAGLLVLLRENGAIQCCSVALLLLWTADEAGPRGRRLRESVRIVALWGVVFGAGLLVQLWHQPAAGGRLARALLALGDVASDPVLLRALLVSVAGTLLVLGSGVILVPPGRRAWVVIAGLPLLATNVLGALAYTFDPTALQIHGPLWPTRFAMLWGLVGAALVSSRSARSPDPTRRSSRRLWLPIAASLLLQLALLGALRDYSPLPRLAAGFGGAPLTIDRLSRESRSFLECLPAALPRRTSIASHTALFAPFHHHDLVWPDFVANAWRPPRMVICEVGGRLPAEPGCARLLEEWSEAGHGSLAVGELVTSFEQDLEEAIRSCTASGPGG